jgi:nucleolar protein 56
LRAPQSQPLQLVLFESSLGYALFESTGAEEIGALRAQVQAGSGDLARFSRLVKLRAFAPFPSAEAALQNINDVSEGIVSDDLRAFLEANAPAAPSAKGGASASSSASKAAKFVIGVAEPKMGSAIQEALHLPCNSNDTIAEIQRGIRVHLSHFIRELAAGAGGGAGAGGVGAAGAGHSALEKAQLGLAHSYSRAKVKFNVNKADNMIIQAIAMIDQLDKDLNTFSMRVREWYSWHFPELARIVKDNTLYARCAACIGSRASLTEETLPALAGVLGEAGGEADGEGEGEAAGEGGAKAEVEEGSVARQILEAARTSMGMDISELDLANVSLFTGRLVALARYRHNLGNYLRSKMAGMAPNLSALIGDVVGARLISHAGSLTNLAKAPASTVQILGAEKALFRALKTKGNTPKYGLIFHSSFIGRAAAKNKGRISRYLANKCSIAARIDSFSERATSKFGERLRDQVEERLSFYETGAAPKRNATVMAGVVAALKAEEEEEAGGGDDEAAAAAAAAAKKARKLAKKRAAEAAAAAEAEEAAPAAEEAEEAPQPKKKKAKA